MKTNSKPFIILILVILTMSCNKPVSILLVMGGHDYDTSEFFDMFHSFQGIELDSVSYPQAIDMLQSTRMNDYDLLFFYDYIPEMPLKDSSIFIRLTEQGKPMLFLHHAICTFQEWDGYQKMVGGKYVMPTYSSDTTQHSKYKHDIDIQVKVLDKEHPVTTGIQDFTIHDEGYFNIQVNEDVYPLFGTNHPDCSSLMGWISQANQSTCLYLMFGHDKYAYENESFQQLLSNSIQWLADQK